MFNQHVPTLPQAFKKNTFKSCRAEVLAEQPVPVGPGLLLSVKPVIAQTPAAVLVPRVCHVFRVNLELDGHGTAFGEGANSQEKFVRNGHHLFVRWGINNCFIHKLGRKIPDLWVFTKSHSSYLLKIKSLNSLLSICTVPIGEGLYQGSNFCQMGAKCLLTDCSHSGTGILS